MLVTKNIKPNAFDWQVLSTKVGAGTISTESHASPREVTSASRSTSINLVVTSAAIEPAVVVAPSHKPAFNLFCDMNSFLRNAEGRC